VRSTKDINKKCQTTNKIMIRVFAFWGVIILLKIYFYVQVIRFFERPLYKGLAITLVVTSLLCTGLGIYAATLRFGAGLTTAPSLWLNIAIGLMVSFLVLDLVLGLFFLLDDIWGGVQYVYHAATDAGAPRRERRHFIKKAGLLIGALPFASFLHGITLGKYNFKVRKEALHYSDLPPAFDGFKIAQISDVHAGSFDSPKAVCRGLQLLQEQGADIIVFTGDLVNVFAEEIEPYLEDFKQLTAPFGKYSVLGNHDYPMYGRHFDSEADKAQNLAAIKAHHGTMQFNLLLNQHQKLEKDGQHIYVAGVENWGRSHHFPKKGDLDQTFAGLQAKDFTVLLSHDPTHWNDKVKAHPKHVHLTMSGHTHGFQLGVDLPFFKWSPIKYVYEHWAGLYQEAEQYLYVNRGFGFLGFAGRVGIFPEITVFELKKK
jgi:predicted MPP superfamily phosphohydrolase